MADIHPSHLSDIAPDAIGALFGRVNPAAHGDDFLRFVAQWLRGLGEGAPNVWHRYLLRHHGEEVGVVVGACASNDLLREVTDLVGDR